MQLAQMERIARRLGPAEIIKKSDNGQYEDVAELAKLMAEVHGRSWKPWMNDIRQSGVPMNIGGGLWGPIGNLVTLNQTTVTGSATEQALIPTALFPVEANVQSGQVYWMFASGTSTTAATPGTYTLAARIGPAPTNASPLFGAVSGAFTPVASATAAQWQIQGFVVIRGSGTANTAVASLNWEHSTTVGGGGPVSANSTGVVGGISASFDSTLLTTSLWVGVTHATSTTNTWTPQMAGWNSGK